MNLLVVRHGIAMDREDFSGDSDDLRPLTPEGIRKMKKNARGIASLVGRPSKLASSPLLRAQQTAEILADQWPGIALLECLELKPDAKFHDLASRLNPQITSVDETVVIVGHEPHLSAFVTWTVGGLASHASVELRKGGACLIEFREKIEKGGGVMKWLAPPKLLRKF